MRKTSHILQALSRHISAPASASSPPPVTYFALDLEKRELERTLGLLAVSEVGQDLEGKVKTLGLCATYDIGLEYVEGSRIQDPHRRHWGPPSPKELFPTLSSPSSNFGATAATPLTSKIAPFPLHILFLGSTLGNLTRSKALKFLRSLPLHPGSHDTLLLGLDRDNGLEKTRAAYDDPAGHTRRFILNGLRSAGRVLGDEKMFDEDKWEYVGLYNAEKRGSITPLHSLSSTVLQDAMRHITSPKYRKGSEILPAKENSVSCWMSWSESRLRSR
jgi:L-histidine Nalpha-methyltransferase / hercynylcysteine S-oxide synthase